MACRASRRVYGSTLSALINGLHSRSRKPLLVLGADRTRTSEMVTGSVELLLTWLSVSGWSYEMVCCGYNFGDSAFLLLKLS